MPLHSEQAIPPRLLLRHSLAARWMHWINFPLILLMIESGILIYWADSDPDGGHLGQVYRIGIGHWTLLRLFPLGFYNHLHLGNRLASGTAYHFFFMWLFGINGVVYLLYTWASGEWRQLIPGKGALWGAWCTLLADLHLRPEPPRESKYNGAQQIAYSAVLLMAAGSIVTGLAIYKPVQLHLLTSLLGGYQSARALHFALTIGYVLFFGIHMVQVLRSGWNRMRAMLIGYEVLPPTEPEGSA